MRTAFFVGVVWLLAGCSSTLPQTATPLQPAVQLVQPEHKALLYAGGPDANDVDVYSASADDPQPKRHITAGLDAPTGMAVDTAGNLYVANNAGQSAPGKSVFWTVTVYKHGRGKPFRTYTEGVGSPVDVAVGSDGTVYVANISSSVTVYPPGSLQPSESLQGPSGFAPLGVALDARGNVYVSYVSLSGSGGHIYKYKPGKTHGKDLGVAFGGSPHGMAVDSSGNLIVAVSYAPGSGSDIEVYAPGKKHPKQTLSGPFQPFMLALTQDNTRLFAADYGSGNNDGAVYVYSYPAGQLLFKDTQGAAADGYGVAIDPSAP